MSVTGEAERSPQRVSTALSHVVTGMWEHTLDVLEEVGYTPTEVARLVVLDPVEADPAGIPKSDTETRSA
jgi:hypothetical protein